MTIVLDVIWNDNNTHIYKKFINKEIIASIVDTHNMGRILFFHGTKYSQPEFMAVDYLKYLTYKYRPDYIGMCYPQQFCREHPEITAIVDVLFPEWNDTVWVYCNIEEDTECWDMAITETLHEAKDVRDKVEKERCNYVT